MFVAYFEDWRGLGPGGRGIYEAFLAVHNSSIGDLVTD